MEEESLIAAQLLNVTTKFSKLNRIHTFTKNICYSPLCVGRKYGNEVPKYTNTRPGHSKILWVTDVNNQHCDKA